LLTAIAGEHADQANAFVHLGLPNQKGTDSAVQALQMAFALLLKESPFCGTKEWQKQQGKHNHTRIPHLTSGEMKGIGWLYFQ
jgi:hypothetical protein